MLGTTLEAGESGNVVPADKIEQYLEALGCHLRPTPDGDAFEVTLPGWRLDLEREIDLIEEIARVYGYNGFADTLPSFSGGVIALPHASREDKLRGTRRALGYTEAISSTFSSEEDSRLFTTEPAVAMGNPLSAEAGMLRPSLLPGMAGMLALNGNRDVASVRLFEYGTVFTGTTAEVNESASLTLGAYGDAVATNRPLRHTDTHVYRRQPVGVDRTGTRCERQTWRAGCSLPRRTKRSRAGQPQAAHYACAG